MAIINCDSRLRDKTHCDLCADKLKIPCWGWFGFNHINNEDDEDGETKIPVEFDLVMCLMCSSKIARNIVFDIHYAAQDYKKYIEHIESIPTMIPASFVKAIPIKHN